ncbi:hypothetical protein OOT46_20785 [Aquabacterium sp. A7-Y]|uniref:hypothetical protein n=1 Tax=Aquabacterium sp. A7-Y TaxID=1349605 RepID=UPI00223C8E30|nr:hypothetical protein [Aquabacterium sp. A7-Y]MCW7540274.1 hypothetical protein [Aquabacterium sp. A7-Y]
MSIPSFRPAASPSVGPVTPAQPGAPAQAFDPSAQPQAGGAPDPALQQNFQQLMMQTAQGFSSQMQNTMQETMQKLGGEEDEPDEGDEPL